MVDSFITFFQMYQDRTQDTDVHACHATRGLFSEFICGDAPKRVLLRERARLRRKMEAAASASERLMCYCM